MKILMCTGTNGPTYLVFVLSLLLHEIDDLFLALGQRVAFRLQLQEQVVLGLEQGYVLLLLNKKV